MAAPARQQRRRPGVPARGDDAQARHRPPDAGRARRVRAAAGSRACSRRCSPRRLRHGAAAQARSQALHEFGRYVNDLRIPGARMTSGADAAKALLLALAEGHRLRAAPARRRGAAPSSPTARWTNVLDFVDWIAAPLRRRRSASDDGASSRASAERARRSRRRSRDHQPGRARRRAERRDAVDAARRQGSGVAARGARRRQRRPAAVRAAKTQAITRRSASRKSAA